MDPDRVWAGRTHPPPLAPDRLLGLGTDEDPGRNDLVILDEDLISKLCTAVRLLCLPDWLKVLILWQDAVAQIVRPFEVPQRDHGVWDSGTSFHELEDTVALQSVLSEYNALLAPDILHRVLIAVKSKHPDMSGIANIDDKVISKRAKLAQHLAND
ncbi:hypothetical protein PaG_00184 [Moesziomyces aphidis]|uniref:Uncharacterized protein n=1 Tax=Moesziomyces aphidis TaxID=84754 RepID=W3VWH6_MOEAP|nr:hypothetical protein PaG_00184 [Moesziomyces aphidis]